MRETHRLRKKIESASELLTVVRTMKAIASVNIRQFEAAVESIRSYVETVELGFQVVLQNEPELLRTGAVAAAEPVGAVVFGSDQGMCGSFNERVADHARSTLRSRGLDRDSCSLVLVGHRIQYQFDASEFGVYASFELPGALEGVAAFVRTLLKQIAAWREERGIERVLLFYNRQQQGPRFSPVTEKLLPIDRAFLEDLADREWVSRTEPMMTLGADELFGELVEEFLYANLYRACSESLASENAARLSAMQAAQRNITERLDELRTEYRRSRQSSITAELLDIVGGYEALRE